MTVITGLWHHFSISNCSSGACDAIKIEVACEMLLIDGLLGLYIERLRSAGIAIREQAKRGAPEGYGEMFAMGKSRKLSMRE